MQLDQIRITKVEIFFALLLIVLIVGTQPFGGGNIESVGLVSKASTLDIFAYLIPSMGVLFFGLTSLSKKRFLATIWPIMLVLLYCGFSISWSVTPQIAFLRFSLLSIITIAMATAVYRIDNERLWKIITFVLAIITVANLASVMLVPDAVHRADDIMKKLLGTWKGLHLHKNIAGPPAAIAALYFLINIFHSKRHKLCYFSLFSASSIFLLGTESRTSWILFAVCLLFIIIRRISLRFFGPLLVNIIVLNFILIATILAVVYFPVFENIVDDKKLFTGRGEIWNSLLIFIKQYPLTGSGFSSFWRVGFNSPIFTLTDGWPIKTGQGHNGYLDLAATIGLPGLLLTLTVFLILPLLYFMKMISCRDRDIEIAFTLFTFSILHNLLESSLLVPRNPVYTFWTLSIFVLMFARAPTPPENNSSA